MLAKRAGSVAIASCHQFPNLVCRGAVDQHDGSVWKNYLLAIGFGPFR